MRIAHISDLHFSKLSFSVGQLFSKAWLGNFNLLFNRGYDYDASRTYALINHFKENEVTDIIISGDLTTTSSKKEFQLAQEFVQALKDKGFNLYLIPGNHDHYTKSSCRNKAFYRYFSAQYSQDFSYTLLKDGVTGKKLKNGWWLVGMDTSLATPLASSNGYFSKFTEKSLISLLEEIPSNEKILLVNHFPFFQHDKPKRWLKRGPVLQKILEAHPNVQLYLHGHTHRRCVADLRKNNLPIILDSGSASYRFGSWNLIDLSEDLCSLTVFSWENENWTPIGTHEFTW